MSEKSSLIQFAPDHIVDGGCDGSNACQAELHIHGCFADGGNCDAPDEHLCRCERPCVGPGIYPSCLDCGGRIGG